MQHLSRRIAVAVSISTASCALAAVASCTHGSYDGNGSFVDGGAEGGARIVLTRDLDPAKPLEVLTTPEGALEVTIPQGAFAAPARIVISRLDDLVIANDLYVPVFEITGPGSPKIPIQIVFRGNNPNGGNLNTILVPARKDAAGAFAPFGIVGPANAGGGTAEIWGLATELGTFSLVYTAVTSTTAFADFSASSCLAKCCGTNGGNFGNAAWLGSACGCASGPNLSCFLAACPDLAPVLARCSDLGTSNPTRTVDCEPFSALDGGTACGTGSPQCNYPGSCTSLQMGGGNNGVCCIQKTGGSSTTGICVNGGMSCTGMSVHCDDRTPCGPGTKCCVFDDESYCTATCPNERHTCEGDGDCNGTTCNVATACPFKVCGAVPTACQ